MDYDFTFNQQYNLTNSTQEVCFEFVTIEDTVLEATEMVALSVSIVSGRDTRVAPTRSMAYINILDDDGKLNEEKCVILEY